MSVRVDRESFLRRLGVITDEVSPNLIEALDWIAAQGLAHVEIRMVDGLNVSKLSDEQVDRVRREVESRGLYVSAVSSPVFKCALDPGRPVRTGDTFGNEEESVEQHVEKLRRVIDIARRLGTRRIRIFSFWREEEPERYRDEIVGHLRRAAEIAAAEDVLLLLENEGSCNGGSAQEVADYVRAVDSPHLRALWDPGNEAAGGRPAYPEGYGHVKDLLAHVHLKDAYVTHTGRVRCVPIGTGVVPYAEQLQALQAAGYDGLFTIETHYVPAGGRPVDGTAMTLHGIRLLLNVLDAAE
jgi:sugar phosphate isomerase/epimerase